jgi:hypothetical protein
VHDGIDAVRGEYSVKLRAIGEVGMTKTSLLGDSGAVATLQVVQCNDVHTADEEDFSANATDVTRCSGDENVQLAASFAADRACRPDSRKLAGYGCIVSIKTGSVATTTD